MLNSATRKLYMVALRHGRKETRSEKRINKVVLDCNEQDGSNVLGQTSRMIFTLKLKRKFIQTYVQKEVVFEFRWKIAFNK
jgi:hypothetical protein